MVVLKEVDRTLRMVCRAISALSLMWGLQLVFAGEYIDRAAFWLALALYSALVANRPRDIEE